MAVSRREGSGCGAGADERERCSVEFFSLISKFKGRLGHQGTPRSFTCRPRFLITGGHFTENGSIRFVPNDESFSVGRDDPRTATGARARALVSQRRSAGRKPASRLPRDAGGPGGVAIGRGLSTQIPRRKERGPVPLSLQSNLSPVSGPAHSLVHGCSGLGVGSETETFC